MAAADKKTGCDRRATPRPLKVRIYSASRVDSHGKRFVMSALAGSRAERLSATIVALTALAIVGVWQGLRWSSSSAVSDYEECAEQAQTSPEGTERTARIMDCGAHFAGRRKEGGGYVYYDFLQNRSFEIAGPNPTEEERRRIDLEYVKFLDSERRDAVSAELAKRRVESLLADFENVRRPPGPPTIITPKNASSPKSSVKRSTPCLIEGSLSCSWTKLRSVVKNAFASTSKRAPADAQLPSDDAGR